MMARKEMIEDIVKALNKASYGLIRIIWSALGCHKKSSVVFGDSEEIARR